MAFSVPKPGFPLKRNQTDVKCLSKFGYPAHLISVFPFEFHFYLYVHVYSGPFEKLPHNQQFPSPKATWALPKKHPVRFDRIGFEPV